jgi:homoserine kinase type II
MTDVRGSTVPEPVLGAFGFDGATSTRFEHGVLNAHWLVERDAEKWVVGRHNPIKTRESVEWEQLLIGHAAREGWPVPVQLPTTDQQTSFKHDGAIWSAGKYLPGAWQETDTPAAMHIRGRLLARLHRDLASFGIEGQRPDTGKTWELDALIAPINAGSFNDLLRVFGQEYPELASLIRRERYRSLRELARLKYPDLPEMPIHGDFGRSNLLWQDGQLTGLLDFDQSRRDALLCDIAPLFMPFMPLELPLARALIEGYQSMRPLTDSEWDLLPALIRAALLWWLGFLLAQWRLVGGEPQGIARTMTVRFPAFEAAEPAYRELRRVAIKGS